MLSSRTASVSFLIMHLSMHHRSAMTEPIRIPLPDSVWLALLVVCFSRFFKSKQRQRQVRDCEDTMY